jgi:hypothetical protein
LGIKQKSRLRRPHRSAAATLLQSIDLAVAVHCMVSAFFPPSSGLESAFGDAEPALDSAAAVGRNGLPI